jgi:DNA-binding NarL/FixJ family response regulator
MDKKISKRSVFVAESESHVREAIRLMIDFQENLEIIGEVNTTESLLIHICRQAPDIILLDWHLPAIHHQRLLDAIKECCPNTVIVAMSIRPEYQQTALEIGADAFLLKNLPPEEFIDTIFKAASTN